MTTISITKHQQAAEVVDPGENFKIVIRADAPIREARDHEVLIKLTCSGLWHSEVRAVFGWSQYCSKIGHEGVRTGVKTCANISQSQSKTLVGRRVGIKWIFSACGDCSACERGYQHNCPKQRNTTRHVPGRLQQYVLADAQLLTLIPNGVSDDIAALLLCAGLIMAGALSRLHACGLVWGGLAHIGIQIAARIKGFRVLAVDTGEKKRNLSLTSGAEVFIDFKGEDVAARVREITGDESANTTIVLPGTRDAFAMAPHVGRNMGFIVCVGLPPNDMDLPISASLMAARGLSIIGSSVGTEDRMPELLQQAAEGRITPSVTTFDFEHVPDLINGLTNDGITGRAVVRIPQ
ncbi:chaperonin 10-like protein [Aspergillus germanicus]